MLDSQRNVLRILHPIAFYLKLSNQWHEAEYLFDICMHSCYMHEWCRGRGGSSYYICTVLFMCIVHRTREDWDGADVLMEKHSITPRRICPKSSVSSQGPQGMLLAIGFLEKSRHFFLTVQHFLDTSHLSPLHDMYTGIVPWCTHYKNPEPYV
jgi:hypothetical protein